MTVQHNASKGEWDYEGDVTDLGCRDVIIVKGI